MANRSGGPAGRSRPNWSSAKANRTHPEPLDQAAYRERNRVKRLFAKAKEFRRFATRHDKAKRIFLGWIHLVFGFIRLRAG
jgi:transposase